MLLRPRERLKASFGEGTVNEAMGQVQWHRENRECFARGRPAAGGLLTLPRAALVDAAAVSGHSLEEASARRPRPAQRSYGPLQGDQFPKSSQFGSS